MERKQKIKSYILSKEYIPLTFDELCTVLDVPDEDKSQLSEILENLIDEMQIIKTKKGRFAPSPDANKTVSGILRCNGRGFFGFVVPDDENVGGDIFIHGKNLGLAYDSDTVLVRIDTPSDGGKRTEGSVIKVLKRGNENLTGVIKDKSGSDFIVKCDNERIFTNIRVDENDIGDAKIDERVVLAITGYDSFNNMVGKVIKILGDSNSIKGNIEAIIYEHGIKQEFDEETLKQAEKIPSEVTDISGRLDLRNQTVFTIDGDDARDFDDAVSIERLENGNYKLGVHIADVTHYVTEGSPLDKEAFERATSVYLADRVIPMLPISLSNGICSLNPHVDRLTLTVFMEINQKGEIVKHELAKSVIRSAERMTYNNVIKLLDGDKGEVFTNFGYLLPTLEMMRDLAAILHERRERRGSINFDFPESAVSVNDMGEPIAISKVERGVSHKMIEEFMLAANETVALYASSRKLPIVYRSHAAPDSEKLKALSLFLQSFGISLPETEDISSKALADILESTNSLPTHSIIGKNMLRAMMKAEYTPENEGHFGLSSEFYCHFTSPIRRYPDLFTHRVLSNALSGEKLPKRSFEVSTSSTEKEQVAEDCERDTDKLLAVLYMAEHIGEEYSATISALTDFGIYAELENCIEGMIPLETVGGDYYIYNERNACTVGKRSGKKFRLGDRLDIVVVRADPNLLRIDFMLKKDYCAKEEKNGI